MRLSAEHPGYAVLTTPQPELPWKWRHLLSMGEPASRELLAGILLPPGSRLKPHILTSGEIGVLVPLKKRRRRRSNLWRLVITIENRDLLEFAPPQTGAGMLYPECFTAILQELGVPQFGRAGGCLLRSDQVAEASVGVERMRSDASATQCVAAFFDHQTGDYDVWLGEDRDVAYLFDHETGDLSPTCLRGPPIPSSATDPLFCKRIKLSSCRRVRPYLSGRGQSSHARAAA